MQRMRRTYEMNLYFKSVFIAIFCVLYSGLIFAQNGPKASHAILDLSKWNFDERNKVSLEGDLEFYWMQQLFPGDDVLNSDHKVYFEFPKLWQGQLSDGQILSSDGIASYHFYVILNPDRPDLALQIPDYYSAYKLFVNGMEIAKNGEVGADVNSSVPHWLPMTVNLPADSDTLDVILQIANFWHSKGGATQPIILGDRNKLQQLRKQEEGFDLILTGALIMGGMFMFGLFWFGKHELPILYFSLYCLSYSYRIFGFGIYTFHSLYPQIPWTVTVHLEYLTLFGSSIFFALYTYHLYREETSRYFRDFAVLICSIFLLVTIVFSPKVFTQLVDPFFIVLSLCLIYILYTYILAAIHKREGSILSLTGTGVLLAVFGYKIMIYYNVVIEYKVLTFIGYLSFFFVQSLILSYRYTRKLQRAKENAESASRAKTDFLSMISHEIRTPLNAVIGLTNYMMSDNPRKDQIGDLKTLKFSAENLYVLINDVLDYSKLDAGKIEFEQSNINLHDLAGNIVRAQETRATEKGIDIKFEYDQSIPKMVVCDGLRLSQILTNLVGNAVKFTEKGSVTLRLNKVARTNEKVSIQFIVEDTGIGIPADKQEIVFDSFSQASSATTRKFGGTGLGLSITKKILDIQNVALILDSKVGVGSRFQFTQTFPVSEFQEAVEEQHEKSQEALRGKTVLLVEDNPVNVMVAKKFLSRWNVQVDIAENGREAIEKATTENYDLILMDLQMPVMDGYTATLELRKLDINIPIIALTASAMLDIGDRVYSCGMNDYITKPFHPDDLYEKIKQHVNGNYNKPNNM